MGKILGIAIKNYGSLKDIKMGQLLALVEMEKAH